MNICLKKIFWVVVVFSVLVMISISAGLYFGIEWSLHHFSAGTGEQVAAKNMAWLVFQIEAAAHYFYKMILPVTAAGILLMGLLFWLILKTIVSQSFELSQAPLPDNDKKKKDFVDQKIEQDQKRRLFLHTLSILQRDGRLLDFFNEDLGLYDDGRIGAAVRSIQEDCKKAVKKYIDPGPVLEGEEGDMVTVEPGFNIDSINLIGKVAGEPPFEGILRHRGWKAGKKEIPRLSDIQDASIITPAEVELQ